jgi:hypothetical protein
MARSKLNKGDVVLVTVDPRVNNGDDEAVALVTRVLDGEEDRVNLQVFLDGDANPNLRNVPFQSKKPSDDDDENGDDNGEPTPRHVAFKA